LSLELKFKAKTDTLKYRKSLILPKVNTA